MLSHWKHRTGAPWRDLPEAFGPWISVFTRFHRWSRAGVWQAVPEVLRAIKNLFAKFKQYRSLATRYDKAMRNYSAMVAITALIQVFQARCTGLSKGPCLQLPREGEPSRSQLAQSSCQGLPAAAEVVAPGL